MYPVRSIRNLRISAVFAGAPTPRKPSTASPTTSWTSSSVEGRASSPVQALAAKSKPKLPGSKSVSSPDCVGRGRVGTGASPVPAERTGVSVKPGVGSTGWVSSAAFSADAAVSSTRSTNVPASIARPSSINSRKLFNAATARAGNNCRVIASPTAPHIDNPVSSASRSIVSIVVLPIPRTGVLITRSSETESSGFWMTFKYEIMSLISARS